METMPHHWHEKCPNMGHPPSPFSFCFSVTKVTTVQPVCVRGCVLVVIPFTIKYIQLQLQKYAFCAVLPLCITTGCFKSNKKSRYD